MEGVESWSSYQDWKEGIDFLIFQPNNLKRFIFL